jgi:hypothetical protein
MCSKDSSYDKIITIKTLALIGLLAACNAKQEVQVERQFGHVFAIGT